MRAVVLKAYGPAEAVRPTMVPIPMPREDDALVRVHAASVNDWEWQMCQGELINRMILGWRKPRRPVILGCDIGGTVESVGAHVKTVGPGDAVYADLSGVGFGAFADYARVPAETLTRMAPGMSFAQAATLPQAGMLAVQGLIDVGGMAPGMKVLLNGAGGGVGTIALQLARRHDNVAVTCVDSAGKLDMLRGLGAAQTIDYQATDFTRLADRYDLIVDTKTNRSPFAYSRVLNPGGVYATVGGQISKLLAVFLLGKPIGWVGGKALRVVALKPNKDLELLNGLFAEGKLEPVIDSTFALDDVAEAFRHYGTAAQQGKIIITMVDDALLPPG
jgi:NADPH:quinone reductase-like Zn-dependent oxidoreductase